MSIYTKNIPYISAEQKLKINEALLNPIEYRKSGLSLNHIIGCPLDCTYCVRHVFDNFSMRQPHRICSDEEAVEQLMASKYYRHGITPIQIFNRATDPFLPNVKKSTFKVLQLLSERGVTSPVLIITRYRIKQADLDFINEISLKNLTILVTYSGITNKRIEPVSSRIAAESLKIAYANAVNYKVILYWRPIVPNLNDSPEHIKIVSELSKYAHATAFTGIFFRDQIQSYYKEHGLPELFDFTARRKIMKESTDADIVGEFFEYGGENIFRKTSCAIAFAHKITDYNGHYGIPELCNVCPNKQVERCKKHWHKPSIKQIQDALDAIAVSANFTINERAIEFDDLSEQNRYFVQHGLGYQAHEISKPHLPNMHGRANVIKNSVNEK